MTQALENKITKGVIEVTKENRAKVMRAEDKSKSSNNAKTTKDLKV